MDNARHYLVLGLDPGIASCGFCLLDMTDHKILEMGAHLFDAPQEDKTKVSLAVKRRSARSSRRNLERTKMRLKHCLKLLKECGLVPEDADKGWLQQSQKGDKPVLKLRARGLDMPLTDREFAQVLYALCSRRGYIPHGKGRQGTDDAEGRKVLQAIKENSAGLEGGAFRTVGEMLYKKGSSRNKGGDYANCVRNSQVQEEARALFSAQRQLGNKKATEDFERRYLEVLTWEKKSADHDARVYDAVGVCAYFPFEKRAADADISSQLCQAYERLGHITVVREDGSEQKLTAEQVNGYLGVLFSPTPLKGNKDCKVTFGSLRRDLDLAAHDVFKGVDPDSEKTAEVFSPKSWRCLRSNGLPKALLQRMLDNLELGDQVCEALTYASTEDSLKERLEPLDLSDEEINALLGMPFNGKLFNGYGNRSLKALELLLDAFEEDEVTTLTDAERASGLLALRLTDRSHRSELLPPYDVYDPTCKNPVVLRSMARMRKIVNAVIRKHGVPDEIHIELGHDLKRSAHEKKLIDKRKKANEAANKRYAETAAGILGVSESEVPGRIICKLAMWEEQNGKDPYTGAPIPLDRLVLDGKLCEIDHILPYSRTCDDSRANKVLVLSKSNQDKKERTPYEWMTSGEASAPSWDEFKARVLTFTKNHRKREHLLNSDLGPETQAGFINRNLNDDRYMSVAVKNYLADTLKFPEDGRQRHVTAVAGGATGNLRHVWGLNFGALGEKDRSDDRHHAVDAAVIAACSESTVQRVAKASALGRETFKHMRESRLADTQPWPTFAEEVIARRDAVIPTRMADHGVTGRAFEDTLYHLDGYTDDKGRYPLVRAKGKVAKEGNVSHVTEDSVRLVDGMAFLRLWLDPDARPNGKVKGKWYAEPVYYADIPAIKAGTYVPRACAREVARINWEPVPESAMRLAPVQVFFGDALKVEGHISRYKGFDINGCRLKMANMLTFKKVSDRLSLGSWGKDTTVQVVQEDCLGHCYDGLKVDPKTSAIATT